MIYFLVALLLVTSWFLPWWWPGVIAFFGGYHSSSAKKALASGCVAIGLSWLAVAYLFDLKAEGRIGQKMAENFQLPNALSLYLIIGAVGGVFACLWSLSGYYLRKSLNR